MEIPPPYRNHMRAVCCNKINPSTAQIRFQQDDAPKGDMAAHPLNVSFPHRLINPSD